MSQSKAAPKHTWFRVILPRFAIADCSSATPLSYCCSARLGSSRPGPTSFMLTTRGDKSVQILTRSERHSGRKCCWNCWEVVLVREGSAVSLFSDLEAFDGTQLVLYVTRACRQFFPVIDPHWRDFSCAEDVAVVRGRCQAAT